jgi:hypothetical protein
VWPAWASNALVCTLNSEIESEGGEKPTPRAFDVFGAPSMLNSLPPCTPFEMMPPRLPLSIGRLKCRSELSMMPGASRVSMYAVPSPSGSDAICLLSTVVPVIAVVVSSSGASAVTSTVSDRPPASIFTSTRAAPATRTWLLGMMTFLKPSSSTVTEYVPGFR